MDQLSTHCTTSVLIGALELNHLSTTLEDGTLEASADLYANPQPGVPRTLRGLQPGCISDGMLEAASGTVGLGPCATGIALSCHRVDR